MAGDDRHGLRRHGLKLQAAHRRLGQLPHGDHLAKVDHPLARFEQGIGTVFPAGSRPVARKRWLAGRLTVAGTLVIDDGAVTALRRGLLLPAGVRAVSGGFQRGDVVDIKPRRPGGGARSGGVSVRRGGPAVWAQNLEIEAVLGYAPRAMIHRDDW